MSTVHPHARECNRGSYVLGVPHVRVVPLLLIKIHIAGPMFFKLTELLEHVKMKCVRYLMSTLISAVLV